MSSTPIPIPTAGKCNEEREEVETPVPDPEKLISDMRALMNHHATAIAAEKEKVKGKEIELQEAKMQIEQLNTEVLDMNQRLKGAENYCKKVLDLEKYIEDILNQLQTANTRISELEAAGKEDGDKIYCLEKQVEELSEFKQKVEVAQVLFSRSITSIEMNQEQTQLNFSVPSSSVQGDSFSGNTGTAKRARRRGT